MNNYIAHHGIKGQKWGVRRYQNPDGTLTALGRKRSGYSERGAEEKRPTVLETRKSGRLSRLERKADIAEEKSRAKIAKYNEKVALAKMKNDPNIIAAAEYRKKKIAKYAKIGLAAVSVGLATYGSIKLDSYLKNEAVERVRNNGMNLVNEYLKNAEVNTSLARDFHKIRESRKGILDSFHRADAWTKKAESAKNAMHDKEREVSRSGVKAAKYLLSSKKAPAPSYSGYSRFNENLKLKSYNQRNSYDLMDQFVTKARKKRNANE